MSIENTYLKLVGLLYCPFIPDYVLFQLTFLDFMIDSSPFMSSLNSNFSPLQDSFSKKYPTPCRLLIKIADPESHIFSRAATLSLMGG
jgi:hypothetical protein